MTNPHFLRSFAEGWSSTAHTVLGAHVTPEGIRFAVWAPEAAAVFVVGDWSEWNLAPLQLLGDGIWMAVLKEAQVGHRYKFAIRPKGKIEFLLKADPYAFRSEEPPNTASIVWHSSFRWEDVLWMNKRSQFEPLKSPMAIYELHLGSWKRRQGRPLSYRELAKPLIEHVKRYGYTHVELMPVTEHPFYGSWGYQCLGFFAPTSRYGSPDDFKYLVNELHKAAIGVILDWVPAHFPMDSHGLYEFDGTHLYEHADPRRGFHPDWKTAIFNYERPQVRSFLLSSAEYWLREYHVDGIRVDAVSSMLYRHYSRKEGEWVPNEDGGVENWGAVHFLQMFNDSVAQNHRGVVTIAEESTTWPGVTRSTEENGLGFTFKWDMGWMNDTLAYLQIDPFYRKHHHQKLTFRGLYAHDENYILALSHDEVVHEKGSLMRKMFGDNWKKRAQLRLLFSYQVVQPGKKMMFMGMEFGQEQEWNHDSQLSWAYTEVHVYRQLMLFIHELHLLYRSTPALYELDHHRSGVTWIQMDDADRSVICLVRHALSGVSMLWVSNWTPQVYYDYQIRVPTPGKWVEVLNSDAKRFGGSGVVSNGPSFSYAKAKEHYIQVALPPLGSSFWICQEQT